MTKRVQRYGLTSAAMAVLTGLERELIINIDDWSIHVQDGVTAGGHKISTDTANALSYQAKNSELTAIAGLATTGIVARTGAHVYTPRTITGTAAEITVTNGDGVAAAPTLSLPAALTFTGKTVTGGSFTTPTITTPTFVTSMKLPFSCDHGGRITLVTGVPYMLSDQTAKATVFFTPARHNMMVGYDGSNIVAQAFAEVSLALNATDNTASNIYDIWFDMLSGVLGTGPAWTTATAGSGARGTGAGTTEYEFFNGMYVNKNAITLRAGGASLGSKALRTCVLVGSIYMTANGQTGVAFKPASAAGGSNPIIGISNALNRTPVLSESRDSTANWTYATNTWRVANAGGTGSGLLNRISWLDCLGQSMAKAQYSQSINLATPGTAQIGVAFNATAGAPSGKLGSGFNNNAAGIAVDCLGFDQLINLGFNYAQAMEVAAVGSDQFNGVVNSVQVQGLRLDVEM